MTNVSGVKRFRLYRPGAVARVAANPFALAGFLAGSVALAFGARPLADLFRASPRGVLAIVVWAVVIGGAMVFTTRKRRGAPNMGSIEVGADGFVLHEDEANTAAPPDGEEHFVSFREVEAIVIKPRTIVARLHDGTRVVIRSHEEGCRKALRDAHASFQERPAFAPAAILEKRDETDDEWRARVSDLGPRYRGPGLSPDELVHVVGDPSATFDQRVGAAIALSALGPKVRVAKEEELSYTLEETVEPALKEALRDAMS